METDMNLARFSLILAATSFFVYGSLFLIFPWFMTSLLGINLSISSAVIDIRATYGGSVLGVSTFFALCSLRDELFFPGLIAQASILSGFIVGRFLGLFIDRHPNQFIYILLIGEIFGLVIALFALNCGTKSKIRSGRLNQVQ
jgi:Domain of unknown function (DUF4345)